MHIAWEKVILRTNTRPILVKLKYPSDKSVIYANVSNLKGKLNVRRKLYFINDDQTEEQQEQRNYFRHLQQENKELDDEEKLQLKMAKGKILANNTVIKPKVRSPENVELLRMEKQQLEQIRAIKMIKGHEATEKGSDFVAYSSKVKSEAEVQNCLRKLKVKFADATHIACAFRLYKPKGPFRQGYVNDQEPGAGIRLLEVLKEKDVQCTAVFVIRYYGGVHLGKRRFEIYENVAQSAVQKLLRVQSKQLRQSRLDRANSQDSIDSIMSAVSGLAVDEESSEITEVQRQLAVQD